MSLDLGSVMKASPARMYDYFLGGLHNFPVDRDAAERVIAAFPDMPMVAQANRAFLRRAVRFACDQGITQFLDLGSGIPTVGNVHEVAQSLRPDARVLYVDVDSVAVTHGRALLANNANATVIQADARHLEQILQHPEASRLLDVSRPLGVIVVALLHFIRDDAEAQQLMHTLSHLVARGSYFLFSHALSEATMVLTPGGLATASRVYDQATSPFTARSRESIEQLVAGLHLVEPGLVLSPRWRPEGHDDVFVDAPERAAALAAVGLKLT
jgi:SAM-dependent methyltransferase